MRRHRVSATVEVSEFEAVPLTAVDQLRRVPMTLENIARLHGLSGFRAPSIERPWLELRLADGCWVRVRLGDDDLLYYIVEPADQVAVEAGIEPVFRAVWGAFAHVGALALASLERNEQTNRVPLVGPLEPRDEADKLFCGPANPDGYTRLVNPLHKAESIECLREVAIANGLRGVDGALNISASFGG